MGFGGSLTTCNYFAFLCEVLSDLCGFELMFELIQDRNVTAKDAKVSQRAARKQRYVGHALNQLLDARSLRASESLAQIFAVATEY